MKYYLGYFYNEQYIPIKDSDIGQSILDVVNFTTDFPSLESLQEYLVCNGLTPQQNVDLFYLIEKGPKNEKYYEPLKNTTSIYLSKDKQFFQIGDIYRLLEDSEADLEFLVYLFSRYTKIFGIDNKIFAYLEGLTESPSRLSVVIEELKNVISSKESKDILEKICRQLRNNEEDISLDILTNDVLDLIAAISDNTTDIANVTICLIKYVDVKRIPAYFDLKNWFNRALNRERIINSGGVDEDESLNAAREKFYYDVVYDYDYTKREYKIVDGHYKTKDRSVFDLGVILEDYFYGLYLDYAESVREKPIQEPVYNNSDDDYDEEFLEEDDFARMGTSSEREGIKIRSVN
ncbi:MAG: hypothetical protein J1F35_00815 [Erysipelotrichales bacterium]|nr:hypothetical protein [Erysipelotrichales bacterium]